MSDVALEEVKLRSPDCFDFLKENSITRVPLSPEVLVEAGRIKTLLGIEEDNYHPKGVSENDLLIVATAKVEGLTLVTEEGRQKNPPNVKSKMRMPAVCALPSVSVECVNSIDLIRSSNAVLNRLSNLCR